MPHKVTLSHKPEGKNIAYTERIDIRCTPEQKIIFQQASEIMSMSIASYLRETLEARSIEIIEAHRRIELSRRDMDMFMDMLDNPPRPTASLVACLKR